MATVELKGGLIVRTDAIALALALESRGVMLSVKDGVLHAAPGSALTAADRVAVKALRLQLMAIAGYEAPE